MFSKHITHSLRWINHNRVYTVLNVLGLSLGFGSVLIIGMYTYQSMQFDDFHTKRDQIYRATLQVQFQQSDPHFISGIMSPVGPLIKEELPEVVDYARLRSTIATEKMFIQAATKSFEISESFFVDPSLLSIFDFGLVQGKQDDLLKSPFTAVMTTTLAQRVFGEQNPVGKVIQWHNDVYTVEGVVETPPWNSSIQFELLISYSTVQSLTTDLEQGWNGGNTYTYLLLRGDSEVSEIEPKALSLVRDRGQSGLGSNVTAFVLQPLSEVHMYSAHIGGEDQVRWVNWKKGDIEDINQLIAIAVLVLLVSTFNLINLSSAKLTSRFKEMGVRAALGADRIQLVLPLVLESIIVYLCAMIGTFSLTFLVVSILSNLDLIELKPELLTLMDYVIIGGVSICMVVVHSTVIGLASSWKLWFRKPFSLLRTSSKGNYRKSVQYAYITVQMTIWTLLVTCATFIVEQARYMETKDIGFEKQNTMLLPIGGDVDYRTAKQEFDKFAGVAETAASGWEFGGTTQMYMNMKFRDRQDQPQVHLLPVDEHFMGLYGLSVAEGRAFSSSGSDNPLEFVVNRSLARQMGWQDPIGQQMGFPFSGEYGRVVGVIDDFHWTSLHNPIEPLALYLGQTPPRFFFLPTELPMLSVRLNPGTRTQTIDDVAGAWQELIPQRPFTYSFIEDNFTDLYQSEFRTSKIIGVFSLMTTIITCIGLFSITRIVVIRRMKEVGVRKVLGASFRSVTWLLLRDFVLLVAISVIVAWTIAYLILNQWIQDFAYRIELEPVTFLAAGVSTLVIVVLTTLYHVLPASSANPVDILKSE